MRPLKTVNAEMRRAFALFQEGVRAQDIAIRFRRNPSHHSQLASRRPKGENEVKPLYGHISPETAYLVEDYPYGRVLRCKIRYWIEFKPKLGWRLVSQTTNPKKAVEVWNKPKASTYSELGACLYLAENGHVKCERIGYYDEPAKVLTFVRTFPGAVHEELKTWARAKALTARQFAAGELSFTINKQRQPVTEADKARHLADEDAWSEVLRVVTTSLAATDAVIEELIREEEAAKGK